jgi:hypothetical protein
MTELNDFNMSVPAAGIVLGHTSQKVYALAQKGEIAVRLIGSRWMCSESSVARYARKHPRITEHAETAA